MYNWSLTWNPANQMLVRNGPSFNPSRFSDFVGGRQFCAIYDNFMLYSLWDDEFSVELL